MNRNWMSKVARSLLAAASFITLGSVPADAQTEIVLHTSTATRVGDWQRVSDRYGRERRTRLEPGSRCRETDVRTGIAG